MANKNAQQKLYERRQQMVDDVLATLKPREPLASEPEKLALLYAYLGCDDEKGKILLWGRHTGVHYDIVNYNVNDLYTASYREWNPYQIRSVIDGLLIDDIYKTLKAETDTGSPSERFPDLKIFMSYVVALVRKKLWSAIKKERERIKPPPSPISPTGPSIISMDQNENIQTDILKTWSETLHKSSIEPGQIRALLDAFESFLKSHHAKRQHFERVRGLINELSEPLLAERNLIAYLLPGRKIVSTTDKKQPTRAGRHQHRTIDTADGRKNVYLSGEYMSRYPDMSPVNYEQLTDRLSKEFQKYLTNQQIVTDRPEGDEE